MNPAFKKVLAPVVLAALLASTASFAAPAPWVDVHAGKIPLAGPRLIQPLKARTVQLDLDAVQAILAKAPHEDAIGAVRPALRLPMPGREEMRFRIAESTVMQPALAAKFPQIRTYVGRSLTDPRVTGRFQIDPRGLRAQIFTPKGTVFIDPFSRGDNRHYQIYFTADMPAKRRPADTVLHDQAAERRAARKQSAQRGADIGNDLRTYRVAIGATFEYSLFHDPSLPFPDKAVVLAELVNVVNRVSGVYERDLGIRMVLIDGNENAIYNTPVQPYTDQAGPVMVQTNTTILDQNVGNENYDIGHVASTGGGGIAGLGVVCNVGRKGAGVTGLPEPVGDAYYIDFVAHEMGHQFGANHTFNGDEATNCGPNRNSSTAYEPGSGVTIMGYAGVCGSQDLAPHSIDTFHGTSFDEIVDFTRNGGGNECAVVTAVNNNPPLVDAGTGGFTIPARTPFELTGGACDADDDAITYQWEEFDLGPASAPNAAATGSGPIFRNFLPAASPTRVFPQLSDLLANTQTMGEILPNANRALKFRLTVRDNQAYPGSGGVGSDDLAFNVTTAAGPFLVTAPNTVGAFDGLQVVPVTWNVAGTDAAPVSCANVDISLSTNGGNAFSKVLAAGVANDGAHEVTLPNVSTTQGRIKVKCANSVFFDVSNANFTITRVVDVVPDAFSFTDVTGAALGNSVVSSPIIVSGITDPVAISVSGGVYRVNGGRFGKVAGMVGPGDRVELKVRAAAAEGRTSSGVLTIGAVMDSFDVTTLDSPDAFQFVDHGNVKASSRIVSAPVTLGGMSAPAPITIEGGRYRINGGAFQGSRGLVGNGDVIEVRVKSSADAGGVVHAVVKVGSASDSFDVITTP